MKKRNTQTPQLMDTETGIYAAASSAQVAIKSSIIGFLATHWNGSPKNQRLARRRLRKPVPIRVFLVLVQTLVYAHVVFILSIALLLVIFRTVNPPATLLMAYRKLDYGWKITSPLYKPLIKIPKIIRTMTVRVEDGDFYKHHGILLPALKNAFLLNTKFGAPIYGGSTITMQTARTIFLVPEKSYVRKYLEIIIALEMEAILGKDRTLELYFNYAEWGKATFGIEAASRLHFKKGVSALARDEAIRLITLLSSPIRYGPWNFQKNGILRGRYEYLTQRFGQVE
jgi:monofunctional biosynthetic peptidoglycan transglycosylase